MARLFSIRLLGLLAVLTLCLPAAHAAKPRAAASLEPSSVELGETARLQIQVIGGGRDSEPAEVKVDGLDIRYLGPSSQETIGFNNGSFTRSSIVSHLYEVTPKRAGTFTIPAVVLNVDGQEIHTEPVALEVTKGAAAGGGGVDARGRGEIYLPKTTAWVGETLPAQLRLMVDTRIRWDFEALPTLEGEGFTRTKMSQPHRENTVQQDGKTWDLGYFTTNLTPTRAGKIAIGPAEFAWRAQIPRAQRARPRSSFGDIFPEDFFGDLRNAGVMQRMKTPVDPVELTVKPLPAQGQPRNFSGAVGRFSLTAAGAPNRVKIGDPVTVKLTISGKGSFDRVSAPVLADAKGWRSYPASEISQPVDENAPPPESKSFEVAVIPEAKQTKMPVFEFSYFDPDAAKYVTLHSESAPLTVEGEPAPPRAESAPATAASPPVPSAPTDILGLRYDAGPPQSTRPLYEEKWFRAAQLVPLAILLLWILARLWQPKGAADLRPEWRRRRAELAAQLRRETERQPFFDTAARVLQLDAALQTGTLPEAIDAATVRRFASEEVPVEEIFEERSAALFAGGGSDSGQLSGADRERILTAVARMGRTP